jgi:aminoglycoside phosphotransferase (APT) family kinase protein
MEIADYRALQGGRTRKTVAFRISGQPDWPKELVVQCDPPVGYHIFPGVVSQFPVLELVYRSGGVNAPQPVLLERDPEPFGSPFMIMSQLPGTPPNPALDFFATPPKSPAMALSLARQMGVLHSLSVASLPKDVPVMLPGEGGWANDLDQLVARVASEFHGPSLCATASLAWMRANLHHVVHRVSIVHGDVLQHNILVDGEEVSAILDWEGVRIGHPAEDIGYMRPMIEQMVSWDRFMQVYREHGGPALSQAEVDYFTLRAYVAMLTHVAHSRNEFEAGRVDDVRTAEVGCSLGPLFVRCLSDMLDGILHRGDTAGSRGSN